MAPHTGTGNHHPVSVVAGDEIVVVTSEDGTKKTFESSSCERAPLTSYRSITLTIALELVTSLPFFNLCQKDTKDTYKEKIMSTTMATPVGSTATAAFTATASTTAAAPSATTAASATATATATTTTATAAPTKSNYFQPIKSPRTDDEDIAKPVGGKKNQNYLMNILTSSLLATGLNQVTSPLRKLAGHPSPLAEEEEEPEEEGLQQPVMENLEDFELSGLLGSFDDIHPEDINDEDKKYLDEAILSAEATLADADTDPTHTNSIPTASSTTETMSTVSTEDSESLLLEDVEEKDVEELASTTATVDESITPFQASVLERMNLTGILESIFTKFKGNNDYTITDGVKLRFAHKLQNELDLSDDDIFVDDYEALLANDVLLQGHVYLTQEALIFFAFLPKSLIMPGTHHPSSSAAHHKHHHSLHPSSHDNGYIIQDGSLAMKLIKPDAVFQRSHRHWVILREKTLSVYKSPTDLYFPELLIDLTTCLRIELEKFQPQRTTANTTTARRYSNEDVDSSPDGIREDLHDETIKTEAVWFKVITTSKTYKFFADNEYTARNWCSNLSKRIFVLSNSNDKGEVLVKIPLSRVVDFEKVNIMKDPFLDGPFIPNGFVVKFLEDPQPKESPNNLEGNEKATVSIEGGETTSSFLELTNYGIDEVFFLFLREGNSFFKKLQELLDERFNGSTDPFFNQKPISEKASVIFERNTAASGGNGDSQLESLKSTLAPQKQTYLMSQMILLSEKMMMTSSPTSTFSPALSRSTTPNTLMKLGRTLSARSRKLIAKRTDSSITTPSPGAGTRSPSGYQDICLPKSLSMTDLKKVQMSVSVSSKEVSKDEFADALDKKLDSLGLQGEGTIVDSYKDTITSSDLEPGTLTRTSTSEGLIDRNSNTQLPVLVQPQPRRAENASLYFEVESSNSDSNYSPTNDDRKSNVLLTLGKAIGLGKPLKNMGHMWMAEPNHFLQMVENDPYYNVSNKEREQSFKNFIGHFLLPNEGRILLASYYVHLQRSVPVYGKLYLSNHELCFRSMLPGYSTKMILPLKDIENCFKEKGLILSFGLVVVIHGHEELFVDFSAASSRDDCEYMLLLRLEEIHRDEVWSPKNSDWGPNYDTQIGVERMELLPNISQPTVSDCKSTEEVAALAISNTRIENARMKLFEDRLEAAAGINIPLILEDSPFYKLEVKPTTSFNITILTIGSRGDVQPYLALAKGLLKEGHHVTIATHLEFKEWIEKHNVGFKEIAGNPAELMNLMVTHGSLSVGFLREANSKFKTFINELLKSSWEACQGADLLIESPSAMAGIHIAEALGIPYMRAFTMPWTRTRAYPHAFIVPDQKKGGSYNYLTHVIFETVFWKGISGQVNKWRVNDLGLARTSLYQMQQFKTPFLYNVSPTIFPPSVDFPDWVRVTGYWFLDEGTSDSYEPPEELVKFLQSAFEDGKKIVYIGFGSIVVNDSKSLTQAVVDAVLDADVRCILNKGWSDRLNKKDKNESDIVLPPEIFSSGNVPHDWLFSRIDAAVHHGGSGTTGATLRAGIPTIIKPFFGDQFFYANRVEDVGVGIALRKLNTKTLSKALKTAVTDLRMIEKAEKVSRMIKKENGVLDAIEAIYSQLEYARSLIINKQQSSRPDLARHKFSDGLLATVPLDELLEYRDEDIELEPESGSINDSPINVSLMLKIDHEDDDEEEDEGQGGSVSKKKRRSN
ncbi:Sterol 3-beta-glucosyltransferase [Scheffersomyces spartinae]|uniref:Sterol 3-beta-glucosyltransferase n=1 Tax=Scheffersomyces spartinae TaxID=45513 RepID=A0A9P7V9Q0_9ASCO|nr:Sterol 3-beta-glucosyltransferase [Scheffersomyces spartinae]KAG7193804.1 Sterol 3-beta-glucosyltransferase [Scheffersomyces spartinae]